MVVDAETWAEAVRVVDVQKRRQLKSYSTAKLSKPTVVS